MLKMIIFIKFHIFQPITILKSSFFNFDYNLLVRSLENLEKNFKNPKNVES